MLASTLTLAQTAATQATATQADRNPTVYINGMPIKGTAVTVGGNSSCRCR